MFTTSRLIRDRHFHKFFKASGLAYEEIKSMPDSEFLALFEKQRNKRCSKYEKLSKLFPHFVTELKRTGVTLMTLWNEYQKEHPDCYSYSQFCYHFQVWRNASRVTMHIEHKAGDKMFVDYAGDRLVVADRKTGKEQPVEVFLAMRIRRPQDKALVENAVTLVYQRIYAPLRI